METQVASGSRWTRRYTRIRGRRSVAFGRTRTRTQGGCHRDRATSRAVKSLRILLGAEGCALSPTDPIAC